MQRRFLHWAWLWLSRKDITRRTKVKTFKIKTVLKKKMKGVFLLWSSNLHNQQFWKNISGTKTRLFLSLNWYLICPPMLGSIFLADRTSFSMTERKHASLTLSCEPRKKHSYFSYALRVKQLRSGAETQSNAKIAHNEFYKFWCTFMGPKCWYFTTNCFSNTKYNHLSYQF